MKKSANWTRADWMLVIFVTLLAIALRLYKLGEVPPGFQFDEAFNAIDAQQVLEGNRPLFLPANAGREVLYTYWQAVVITVYGFFTGSGQLIAPYTLRLASAIGGITVVPLIYTLLRVGLRRNARLIAAFVAIAQSISMWHIHFSHFGIRVVWMPVLFTLAFGLYWIASTRSSQRGQLLFYALSGVATGLTVWNHPTGRFAPFVLIVYTLWLWVTATAEGAQPNDDTEAKRHSRSQQQSQAIVGLLAAGIVAFIVFLPLGLEFFEHPDFFFSHAADSSFLNEAVSNGAPVRTLALNFIKVLGMFSLSGDRDWTHNLPGRPAFDPLMSIAFLLGLFLWFRRISDKNDPDRDLLFMMFVWLIVMLFPSILSNDAPDYSRTMPSHPALMIAPGVGLAWIWMCTRQHTMSWIGPTLSIIIIVVSGSVAFYDYFERFAARAELYYAYDVDKLDTLDKLAEMSDGNSVYLSRLWANHATSIFLRGQLGIQSIETSETIVLPPAGKGAVYAFPHEQVERADDIMETFPNALRTDYDDPQGEPLFHVVEVSVEDVAQWPVGLEPLFETEVGFDDGPTLLGMRPVGKDGSLLLYWRAERKMLRDLTSFVHFLDEQGNKVAQVDRAPGSGTYRTPDWEPGERIIDQYWPVISDPCISGSTVRVVAGWYQLADDGRRRARSDGVGDIALAGRMIMPERAYAAEQLVPSVTVNAPLSGDANLVGYTLWEQGLEAGSLIELTLYWEGIANSVPLAIRLSANDETSEIWQGSFGQNDDWEVGKRFCRRLPLRLPADIEAGDYQLQIVSGQSDPNLAAPKTNDVPAIDLVGLTINASQRIFQPPSDIELIGAEYIDELEEDAIGLVGFQMSNPELATEDNGVGDMELMLIWRSGSIIESSYSVFVHVQDANGQIIAQSDAVPGNNPTNLWIPGEIILDTHTLSNVPMENVRIFVGLYDPLTTRRLSARDADGRTIPDGAIELTVK